MNYLSIFLISSLSFALIIYIYLSRKVIKTLQSQLVSFQLAGQKVYSELQSLKDKYRQLAAINELLRGPTNQKSNSELLINKRK